MTTLAGFILIPYGAIGSFRATELLRRSTLPVADCGLMAMLGLALVFAGMGLLLGAPIGGAVLGVVLAWRMLALYNARLRRGRLSRTDLWPAAWIDCAVAILVIVGSG